MHGERTKKVKNGKSTICEKNLVSFLDRCQRLSFASDHTATNTPDLFRTLKLTVAGPGQYWGGGPPGKPFGCCWLFAKFFSN